MSISDLTEHQAEELAGEVSEFVDNLALLGLRCIVIVQGRGVFRVAYSKETAHDAPEILASAYDSAKAYNASKAN